MRLSAKILGIALLALVVLTIVVWLAVLHEDRRGILTVSFLDIGQGDSIFIEAPSGRQVLIDGGRDRRVLRELSDVMPWWDRSIDLVIGTHPDLDHIGGLPDVLERYRILMVMRSSVLDEKGKDSEAFNRAIAQEEKSGAQEIVAHRGQRIDLGPSTGSGQAGHAYLEILSPDRDVPHVDTNMGCVVARLVYGKTAFMLSCDAPQAMEEYLVRLDGEKLHSNVLKAGHHGSRTSSSPLFVGYVNPEYAVFSRGCHNSYGHPHQEVIDLFKRFEIPTLDTCADGTITFISDGQKVVHK